MKWKRLPASFGLLVYDINLAQMEQEAFDELYALWLEFALLIFPGQFLDKADQVAFARRFGDLEFDLAPISNVRKDGSVRLPDDDVVKILKGNMGWHADSTYMPVQAKGAVFSAHQVPAVGGETGWADMRAAYEALSDVQKRKISTLSAHHSLAYSQAQLGHTHTENSEYSGYGFHDGESPLRPLVKIHPETRRPSLLIGRHAYGIPGLDPDASQSLLANLERDACQAERVYFHQWQAGDVVVWDNRCLLHKACPWDMNVARVMYHSRIKGDPVSERALNQS